MKSLKRKGQAWVVYKDVGSARDALGALNDFPVSGCCGTLSVFFGLILPDISISTSAILVGETKTSKSKAKSRQGGAGFWLDPEHWHLLAQNHPAVRPATCKDCRATRKIAVRASPKPSKSRYEHHPIAVRTSATRVQKTKTHLPSLQIFDKPMKVSFARTKSDVVAKADGTFVPRPKNTLKTDPTKKQQQAQGASGLGAAVAGFGQNPATQPGASAANYFAAAQQAPGAAPVQAPAPGMAGPRNFTPSETLFIQQLPAQVQVSHFAVKSAS